MTHKSAGEPLLDAAIRFDNLPPEGRTIEVEPDTAQRAAIAERLNVDVLDSFRARLHAVPIKGGVQVRGNLEAQITQSCVVSFVPVTQRIAEDFSRVFLLGREDEYTGPPGAEVFVDLEGEDLPDYFEGPEVDFTELLLETVSLAVDPYPRAPGAELPAEAEEDGKESSPFASLEQLKSPGD